MKGIFKKCFITKAVDETDDNKFWNSSEEDWNVQGECEEDEGTDHEDGVINTGWYR